MGFVKEDVGIDFIIQSEPLTSKERKEISEYIKSKKSKKVRKIIVEKKIIYLKLKTIKNIKLIVISKI